MTKEARDALIEALNKLRNISRSNVYDSISLWTSIDPIKELIEKALYEG